MNNTIETPNELLDALARFDAGDMRFGDAGLIVTAMDDLASDHDVSVSYLEMLFDLPPGTFEELDARAMRQRYGS